MKEIIKILQNYKLVKKEFYLTLITRIALMGIVLYIPIITKEIYSVIENNLEISELYFKIGILAVLGLISVGMTLYSNLYQIKLWLFLYKSKNLLYRKIILDKNHKDIQDIGTGKLLTRLEGGIYAEVDIFTRLIKIIVEVLLRGSIIIAILTYYISGFFYIFLVSVFLLTLIIYFLRGYIKKYNEIERTAWENDGRVKVKIIMEQLLINLYSKKERELETSKKHIDNAIESGIKVDVVNEAFYKFVELIVRIFEVFILIIVGTIILTSGTYGLADLVMFTWYIIMFWEPLDAAITSMNVINRNWEKYKKLQDFINIPNDIINGKNEYKYKSGKIEFKSVNFEYSPEKKIFNNLNLKFLEGKKNALIGHSGGGKSTITKLLLRLYDINSGEILLDGQDLKKLNINSFYKNIGYLPQEASVFDGTIRENLEYAFSDTPSTPGRGVGGGFSNKEKEKLIWEALDKSRISKMIKSLDKGLDTEVGEKGIKLSGGEKQRLAIARIFLKDPKIIILDEPTSALDSISESKISESLEELTKNRTSIIIAHRLQTVINSDKIIIIEDGKVESEGKHEYLLNNSKTYKNLVDLQNGKIEE